MVNSMLFGEVMKQHESSKHSKGIPIVMDFKKNETKKLWFLKWMKRLSLLSVW
jgi:hypothetical protein